MKKLILIPLILILMGAGCTVPPCIEWETHYGASTTWENYDLGTDYERAKEMADGRDMFTAQTCIKRQSE